MIHNSYKIEIATEWLSNWQLIMIQTDEVGFSHQNSVLTIWYLILVDYGCTFNYCSDFYTVICENRVICSPAQVVQF